MASTIAVSNETKSSSVRTTKDGRQIRYNLQVIQQPERARACGSGAKSSADRRPVDPPPIVELRVFENDQEITFAYNANFFLHASLENARTIAPGRTPSTTPSFPVLTGTPVAGMAYLDRPAPAGYFIFPDLSVGHEGKYRLSFALFQNLSELKDLDPEDPDVIYDGHHFVTHRAEVKSAPFTVFSAKKFPGLSESTALSRMVAEQGCRVRIRRDVRMRRRENKGSKEWDEYDEEGGYDASRRTATPDTYGQTPNAPLDSDRPRSVSNASNHSLPVPRRPSMDEMNQSYQSTNNYQQMAPPQNNGYSQMSSYGSNQHQYQSQYTSPPSNGMMQPPQPPYAQQSQPVHHNYQNQSAMQLNQHFNYPHYHQQSHYEQQAPVRQEPAPDYAHAAEYRRPSVTQSSQQYPGPSQIIPPYNPVDQYNRSRQMSQPVQPLQTSSHGHPVSAPMHAPSIHSLPTLKTSIGLHPPSLAEKLDSVSPTYQSPPSAMSSGTMSAATMSAHPDASSQHYGLPRFAAQGPPPVTSVASTAGTKRSFGSTFDDRHVNQRLTQGARPNPQGLGYNYDECNSPDMEEPMDRAAMSYRRADGTQRQRHVPEVGH